MLGRTHHVRDYSDYVGGGRHLPPPVPGTAAEEREALKRFVVLERQRTQNALADDIELVIIDRSLHTLIAHCTGIERHVDYNCARLAQETLLEADLQFWPDLIIYLDAAVNVINARNSGKFPTGSIFMDEEYNLGFRSYFEEVKSSGRPHFAWIDGSLSRDDVLSASVAAISSFVNFRVTAATSQVIRA